MADFHWRLINRLTGTCCSLLTRGMKQKLTLTVDQEAVATAKRVAKKRGVSVSSMFEKWSKELEDKGGKPNLGERLRGAWKTDNMPTVPTGEVRLDYILQKHCR
jgi:hypothetical protein